MTTELILKKLVEEGKLRLFEPYLREGEVHVREIFMTNDLWKHIEEYIPTKYGLEYQVKVEQHLASFINGNKIRSGKDIKELKPFGNGVWEFKISDAPESRIFGGFIEQDVFIAFYMKERNNIAVKDFDRSFKSFTDLVKNQWRILFNNKPRLLSSNINKLITNGVTHDPRKK